jgi:site-specific recombinase XerD
VEAAKVVEGRTAATASEDVPVQNAAGIPKKRIHPAGNTRHSRATAELQRGSDPRLVRALLGHASFSTTKKHYAEIGAAALRRVVSPERAACVQRFFALVTS